MVVAAPLGPYRSFNPLAHASGVLPTAGKGHQSQKPRRAVKRTPGAGEGPEVGCRTESRTPESEHGNAELFEIASDMSEVLGLNRRQEGRCQNSMT